MMTKAAIWQLVIQNMGGVLSVWCASRNCWGFTVSVWFQAWKIEKCLVNI